MLHSFLIVTIVFGRPHYIAHICISRLRTSSYDFTALHTPAQAVADAWRSIISHTAYGFDIPSSALIPCGKGTSPLISRFKFSGSFLLLSAFHWFVSVRLSVLPCETTFHTVLVKMALVNKKTVNAELFKVDDSILTLGVIELFEFSHDRLAGFH